MKTLLVVEDSEDDRMIMQMACNRAGIPHSLRSVNDGQCAIDYLLGTGQYSDRIQFPVPDLIFLDISLPKKNGLEVLGWIRTQAALKHLPVVIVTGSQLREDVEKAYVLGTTSYLQKVPGVAEFGQAVRVILKYWLEINVPL
jgi:CheY-like chemotaxis protein